MLIAGNWKMNTDRQRAVSLARDVLEHVGDSDSDVLVAICPPFVNLEAVSSVVSGSAVRLGAQNVHHAESGAFTGEVSVSMLQGVGCHYAIVGHSERRQYFCETDETVNEKVKACVDSRLVPIVCVGESLSEREENKQEEVVTRQVRKALSGVDLPDAASLVVAYEPVWAIGTGRTATPEQAQEVHALIRGLLVQSFGETIGKAINILYGGSMNPGNAEELLAQTDVDGGLIGGASLKPDQFAAIVESARNQAAIN